MRTAGVLSTKANPKAPNDGLRSTVFGGTSWLLP